MTAINVVLAEKLGLNVSAEADEGVEDATPSSPMRQMRRAMARAADKSVGLSTSILGIDHRTVEAETLIEEGPEGWIVLGLRNGTSAGLTGLILLDSSFRSALVDMQTMGRLLPKEEEPRKITRIDALMSVPFASTLLAELELVTFAAGEVALSGYDIGPMEDLRTAGLVMLQGQYATWQVNVQLGGEAEGEMMIALRTEQEQDVEISEQGDCWNAALRNALADAPADLDAVLAKQRMPIEMIEGFEVGQVIPLPGVTVGSIRLKGPDGKEVAQARLGQVAGKRAVRLEMTALQMQEDVPRMAAQQTQPALEETPIEG